MFLTSLFLACLLSISVNLYQCSALASIPDCSFCLAQNSETGFDCGWCPSSSQCQMAEACTGSSFATTSGNCPGPSITSVSPNRGPPQGGTTIVIQGSNLGVNMNNIMSITVGNMVCSVFAYEPGREITCVIDSSDSQLAQMTPVDLIMRIMRNGKSSEIATVVAEYFFRNPMIESVSPSFGPVSGGTVVVVRGSNLDIGNSDETKVQFVVITSSSRKRQAQPAVVGNCSSV